MLSAFRTAIHIKDSHPLLTEQADNGINSLLTGIPDLDLSFVHRTLLLPSTQRICHHHARGRRVRTHGRGHPPKIPGRLPWRDATVSALPEAGGTGQDPDDGQKLWKGTVGVDTKWEHCLTIVDGKGKIIETGVFGVEIRRVCC
jgi:hypothetical protein